MNENYRDGLDVRIAFKSCLRRGRYCSDKVAQIMPDASLHVEQVGEEAIMGSIDSDIAPQRSRFKTIVRGAVRYIYRAVVKPILRPIAFRGRRYFIEGIRQELKGEEHQAILLELQSLKLQSEALSACLARAEERMASIQMSGRSTESQRLQRQEELLRRLDQVEQCVMRGREIQSVAVETMQQLKLQCDSLSPQLDRVEQYTAANARRIALNCEQGEVLIRTAAGFVLCATSDYALLACLIDTGDLEVGTRRVIEKYLKRGDVFIDVGANIGLHTLAAARAMQGQGKVIAFEPFEQTKRLLEKSVWLNGFSDITEIHQAAVSNVHNHQSLYIGETSGHHSLYSLAASAHVGLESVEVQVVQLDKVLASEERIDLMKIDVEGAELEVIEGAANIISCNPDIAIIAEFGPSHLRRAGHTATQWMDAFERFGLEFRVINTDSGDLELWSVDELEKVESMNLFFARPDSAAWKRLL